MDGKKLANIKCYEGELGVSRQVLEPFDCLRRSSP